MAGVAVQREGGDGAPPLPVQNLGGVGEPGEMHAVDEVPEVEDGADHGYQKNPYGLETQAQGERRVFFLGRILLAVELDLFAGARFEFGRDENFERSFLGTLEPMDDSLRKEHQAVVANLSVSADGDERRFFGFFEGGRFLVGYGRLGHAAQFRCLLRHLFARLPFVAQGRHGFSPDHGGHETRHVTPFQKLRRMSGRNGPWRIRIRRAGRRNCPCRRRCLPTREWRPGFPCRLPLLS